jgi:sugar phosphate isomerase/epimerase
MFKLSVITDEVSQDLNDVVSFAKTFNLAGVEIRTLWNLSPHELLGRSKELFEILDSNGLRACAIASPIFKSNLHNSSEYEEHLRMLHDVIELGKRLDVRLIRVFAFWRSGSYGENLNEILTKFRKAADIAEDEGVLLCVENEPSTYLTNGRLTADFVNRLGYESVSVLWDPGNDIMDPEGEIPYPEGYRHVRGLVSHVHIKDGVRSGERGLPEFRAIGEGEVDYQNQLSALLDDGYDGFLSLETHWRLSSELTSVQVTRPGGDVFSKEGFLASKICMENLLKIINKVSGTMLAES